MKAMVLAAGLGTRLRPLTGDGPKALAMLAGQTFLERVLLRLHSFGIDEVIVNLHHQAEQIASYLAKHDNFGKQTGGMRIELSWEDELLDTGGGLKKAAEFFLRDGRNEPFILHNVDVLSSIDLAAMLHVHQQRQALATLAVFERNSTRRLLFDNDLRLCGRRTGDAAPEMVLAAGQCEELAFTGIHVLSPRIFSLLTEQGAFPIIPAYLRLAGAGEPIVGYRAEGFYWRDLGTPQSVEQAARDLSSGAV